MMAADPFEVPRVLAVDAAVRFLALDVDTFAAALVVPRCEAAGYLAAPQTVPLFRCLILANAVTIAAAMRGTPSGFPIATALGSLIYRELEARAGTAAECPAAWPAFTARAFGDVLPAAA